MISPIRPAPLITHFPCLLSALTFFLVDCGISYARGSVSRSDWLHPPAKSIVGKITSINLDVKTISVEVGEGKDAHTVVESAASDEKPVIEIDGKAVEFSALQPGMVVHIKTRGNVALEIRVGDDESNKSK